MKKMRTIIALALAATPAMAQPRLDVPVPIMATEAMPTPLCFFFFCGLSLGAVPDDAGGFVPFTNSRDMPDGSLRPYDPIVDGYPPGYGPPPYQYAPSPQGTVTVGPPEPYAPGAYYDPTLPPVAHTQRRSRHAAGKACYDGSGHFVGVGNEDCGYDSNPPPLPDTREMTEPE